MKLKITRLVTSALLYAASSGLASAAPPGTSPYATDLQYSFVEDHTSEGISVVNMVMCYMAAMSPHALVNEGNYVALVDDNKCDPTARADSGNSGSTSSGSNAAQYSTTIVNSARDSSNDPMIVKAWMDDSLEEVNSLIAVHAAVSEAPTNSNPYGQFRVDFCGQIDGEGACFLNGYLQAASGELSFYEQESLGDQSGHIALSLAADGTDSGSGRMSIQDSFGGLDEVAEFTFAYNENYFRRFDGEDDRCFTRDAQDPETGFAVWRYGLYNETTGARIERNSGFPIEYTGGGTTYHGYMGYHGLWLPPEALSSASSGDTVKKVDYGSGAATKTDFTLVRAGGKLTKHTRNTTTLAAIDKIRFIFWASSPNAPPGVAGYSPGTEYQVFWNETIKKFVITGYRDCSGDSGCRLKGLGPVAVGLNYWKIEYPFGLFGWSQALGGEVFIDVDALLADGSNSASTEVAYRVEDVVYPSEYAGIGALRCILDCPTPAGIAAENPFGDTAGNFEATLLADLVSYTLNAATGNLEHADGAVSATSSTLEGQFQWGIRSGRLFPLSAATTVDAADGANDNSFQEWGVDQLDTYYVWQTGPNPWNQFSGVKDTSDEFVTFEPPLRVRFTVPLGDSYGDYAGLTIFLDYGGFGDLWGFPGKCVDRATNEQVSCEGADARYVPEFTIPYDETTGRVTGSGDTTYLVKWLDREIRLAQKDLSTCQAEGLALPVGDVTLPGTAGLKDLSDPESDAYIGPRPTVTDAPRVIQGQVQY